MAGIRFRIQFFRGKETIDLARLSVIPDEFSKFLHALGEDLGIPADQNNWRASKFRHGSLSMAIAAEDGFHADQIRSSADMTAAIVEGNVELAHDLGVSDRTLLRFSDFTRALRDDEPCRIGVYKTARSRAPSKWLPVTSDTGRHLANVVNLRIEYEGSLFGTIHSLYKEGDSPHFNLRDMARGSLVKCLFKDEHYNQIVRALAVRDNRVNVRGVLIANRLNREVESIRVREIDPAEMLSDEDFERFFGCSPDLTGDVSTADFIAFIRDDGG